MDTKPGATATCAQCRREIVFIGPNWDHPGEIKPRHPAIPADEQPATPTPQWMDAFDAREQKSIDHARLYAAQYDHGDPGHMHLKVIAKLAAMLDRELLGIATEYTIERTLVQR